MVRCHINILLSTTLDAYRMLLTSLSLGYSTAPRSMSPTLLQTVPNLESQCWLPSSWLHIWQEPHDVFQLSSNVVLFGHTWPSWLVSCLLSHCFLPRPNQGLHSVLPSSYLANFLAHMTQLIINSWKRIFTWHCTELRKLNQKNLKKTFSKRL